MQGTHNSSPAAATDEPEESPEIGLQAVERRSRVNCTSKETPAEPRLVLII
jgi:hypothetical protein